MGNRGENKKDMRQGVYQAGVKQKEIIFTLEPDFLNDNFKTTTVLKMTAAYPVEYIDLDAHKLEITDCAVTNPDNKCCIEPAPDDPEKRIRVHLPEKMKGEIELLLAARGVHSGLLGLYKSMYDTGDKEKGYFLTSQCEEQECCRIIPVIDHPAAKAVFTFRAIVPKDLMVIFNMPVKEETAMSENRKMVEFEKTPMMSPYLLYIGIGKFEILTDETDPRFRAITVPGKIEYAKDALIMMRESVHDLEKRLGVPYPLPRLDIIAVPQFQFGAMENWGVLAHRENLMLYYPGKTSLSLRKRIWETVAHEVSHQWFGNLVSPADWQYVWLNETLATYFGNDITQRHNPEWAIWPAFLREDFKTAIRRASYLYDFPVQLPEGMKIDISTHTAPIIYGRGACIYRQTVGYLGEDLLAKGLGHFLGKHQYGNADTDDFYERMTEATGKPIREIMQSWLESPGHPIIEAVREGNKLILTQRRFTYLTNDSENIWTIPLTYTIWKKDGSTETGSCVMNKKSMTIDLPADTEAYKLNAGHTGLYRAKYAEADLDKIAGMAIRGILSQNDIFGIETDYFDLAMAGEITIDNYLTLVNLMIAGSALYLPMAAAAADNLTALLRLKRGTVHEKRIAALGKKIAERALWFTGLEPKDKEPETTTILRSTMIRFGALCSGGKTTAWRKIMMRLGSYRGNGEVEKFVLRKFRALLKGENIHRDIRAAVLTAGAFIRNDIKTFAQLRTMHDRVESEGERMEILSALGEFHDAAVMEKVWTYALDDVPEQNKFIPLAALGVNPFAPPLLFGLCQRDRDKIDTLEKIARQRIILGVFKNWQTADTAEIARYFTDRYQGDEGMAQNIRYFCEVLRVENRVRHELN